MLKKIGFKGLNYNDLERYDAHDLKRDEMTSFYQTFDFLELIEKWPEIVGAKLSNVTSPLKLKQDTLFIVTKHSIYSQELSFVSEQIKEETFKFFPKLRNIIKKIAYQTQEKFFEEQKKEAQRVAEVVQKLHPQSPRFKLLKIEAEKIFHDVEDAEIRTRLISLYIQSR
jgi:hypothetical protein